MLNVRPESPADRERIFEVEAAAFEQRDEAELVDALHFDSVFQVVELTKGALDVCSGHVRFHHAFSQAEKS